MFLLKETKKNTTATQTFDKQGNKKSETEKKNMDEETIEKETTAVLSVNNMKKTTMVLVIINTIKQKQEF